MKLNVYHRRVPVRLERRKGCPDYHTMLKHRWRALQALLTSCSRQAPPKELQKPYIPPFCHSGGFVIPCKLWLPILRAEFSYSPPDLFIKNGPLSFQLRKRIFPLYSWWRLNSRSPRSNLLSYRSIRMEGVVEADKRKLLLVRIELTTLGLLDPRSNQLSYRSLW